MKHRLERFDKKLCREREPLDVARGGRVDLPSALSRRSYVRVLGYSVRLNCSSAAGSVSLARCRAGRFRIRRTRPDFRALI